MAQSAPSDRVVAWRKRAGIGVVKASKLIGVSAPTLRAIERKQLIPQHMRIREAFRVHCGIALTAWERAQ
jgi:hypothetical protein